MQSAPNPPVDAEPGPSQLSAIFRESFDFASIENPFAKRDKIPRESPTQSPTDTKAKQKKQKPTVLTPQPTSSRQVSTGKVRSIRKVSSPQSARSERLPSIDFDAIEDPFKKRDKIALAPEESEPSSRAMENHVELTAVSNDPEPVPSVSPPPVEAPLATSSTPERDTVEQYTVDKTPSPSRTLYHTITAVPPVAAPLAPLAHHTPSNTVKPSATPTPFKKRDMIPRFPEQDTPSANRLPTPPTRDRTSSSVSDLDQLGLDTHYSDDPSEVIAYDDILIPTVYKQLKRQGAAAIEALDPEMRRKFFLTARWYARQKKMSPLMDSMYVLNEVSKPTIEPPTPTAPHMGTSTTKPLALGQQSPLSEEENQPSLPIASQTVKVTERDHHQQNRMPHPTPPSPQWTRSAVPQGLPPTNPKSPDQTILMTSSPTHHPNTIVPTWQTSVAQYPSPTPSNQFRSLGEYTQPPGQEPSPSSVVVQVDMPEMNPQSESDKPPSSPKSRRRKRLTYCCCTIF